MNQYFTMTKHELTALGTTEARAELDRRAAKKAAKSNNTSVHTFRMIDADSEIQAELSYRQMVDQIHDLLNALPLGDLSREQIMTILNDQITGQ